MPLCSDPNLSDSHLRIIQEADDAAWLKGKGDDERAKLRADLIKLLTYESRMTGQVGPTNSNDSCGRANGRAGNDKDQAGKENLSPMQASEPTQQSQNDSLNDSNTVVEDEDMCEIYYPHERGEQQQQSPFIERNFGAQVEIRKEDSDLEPLHFQSLDRHQQMLVGLTPRGNKPGKEDSASLKHHQIWPATSRSPDPLSTMNEQYIQPTVNGKVNDFNKEWSIALIQAYAEDQTEMESKRWARIHAKWSSRIGAGGISADTLKSVWENMLDNKFRCLSTRSPAIIELED